MKRYLPHLAAVALVAGIALAGPIKTWATGELITAGDVNANFNHIHNLMVGGHGARLINADVNASAAIAHSKLATPVLLPKATALLSGNCNVIGNCATSFVQGFTSVAALSTTGSYRFTFSTIRPNTGYQVYVQPHIPATANLPFCYATAFTTSAFDVQCLSSSSLTSMSTLANTAQRVSVVVLDDDP